VVILSFLSFSADFAVLLANSSSSFLKVASGLESVGLSTLAGKMVGLRKQTVLHR